ncbi:thymidine kinase [Vibrio cholerae]|uniref:thymidine kinase n=1 Tax=Vibrio cholerae TaxID=666 RepID=UPI00053C14E6|nr:hypothetical protein [Vibrio cholerae]
MGSPYLLEPEINLDGTNIILTTGVMGAGKTAALIDVVEQLEKRGPDNYLIIKPEVDTRDEGVRSRDGRTRPCTPIGTQEELVRVISLSGGIECLLVDEAQFFSPDFIKLICLEANLHGIRNVAFYSLKTDYLDNTFEAWKEITRYATKMYELQHTCELCGNQNAVHNMRVSGGDSLIEVGTDNYKAVCSVCWSKEKRV